VVTYKFVKCSVPCALFYVEYGRTHDDWMEGSLCVIKSDNSMVFIFSCGCIGLEYCSVLLFVFVFFALQQLVGFYAVSNIPWFQRKIGRNNYCA
jgi:hypothetical protein